MNQFLFLILVLCEVLNALDFDTKFDHIISCNSQLLDLWWRQEKCDDFYNQINMQFRKRVSIAAFSQEHLSNASEKLSIFYPFGGPDVFYPDLLFKNMSCLCLVGL